MSLGTIDERIVEMTFKGQQFVDGIKNTVSALQALKDKLNSLKGSESDINNLDSAGKKFSLSGMASGIEGIGSKFSALGLVGLGVLTNIANKAIDAGITLVKSLTIDPIKAGLDVYETKINAIQTILANTQSQGTKLKDVTASLNQLNTYANQTVYNFGQMAHNIGTFTAAGVDLKTSVASIKGIANLAALSGSSADQASQAMYQLSQAIAAGSVKLQDWNSVVNAGLGGKVFQNALEQTARATGVHIDAIIKKAGSFRNSLQQGWLSSKILTQTLETFTGDLSAQQLKSLGYSQQQIPLILAQAKAAQDSATKIRTVTQLQAALREEVATAWSTVWESLIGNIGDATTLLSAVHNTLETLFTKPIYDFNRLLQQWDKLGGRDQIIQAISESFSILGKVVRTIGDAFRQVFPPVTAQTLIAFGVALDNMVSKLEPSKKTLAELKSIFVGVFSAIKIVIDIVKDLVGSLVSIGAAASGSAGGFLGIVARIGDFVAKLEKMVATSQGIKTFFDVLTADLRNTIRLGTQVVGAVGGIGPIFAKLGEALKPVLQKAADIFKQLGNAIAQAIVSGNFSAVVSAINGLLLTKVLLVIKKFFLNFGSETNKGGGLLKGISESFEALTGALKNMQQVLKATILDQIAGAIGVLTLSLFVLSTLNVTQLGTSIAAIGLLMSELVGTLSLVTKAAGSQGIVKMAAIGVALNLLATAILILSAAVAILSHFSWEELGKGIGAIAALLLELVVATTLMSGNAKGVVASAYAMQVMGVALNLLAAAVKKLGSQDFNVLLKGIGSIGVLLLLLTAFERLSGGKNLITTAAGMVLIGAALNIMAKAIVSLGAQSVASLVKGIASLAAVLLILVVAMNVMEGSLIGAAAMVVAAAAILILAKALTSLGGLSWSAIAKSLVELAGALVLLAAATIVMVGSLPGAAALLVVAAALAILTPVLVAFSNFSWAGIAKSLILLAGAFVVIAAAGILLTPLVVVLLGLGAAIVTIGVGILAAGVGLALFGGALGVVAVGLGALGVAIAAFVGQILTILPNAIHQVANIVLALAVGITKAGPAILIAITAVLLALLGAISRVIPRAAAVFAQVLEAILSTIIRIAPKIINTFYTLVLDILNAVAKYYPKFVVAGLTLIVNLLNGIARQIPRVAAAATNVIIAFINAIGSNVLRIAQAGVHMVITLVNGIANTIRADTPQMNAAGRNLASAIIQGMISGILGGIGGIIGALGNVASSAISAAKGFFHINSPSKDFQEIGASTGEGMALGIHNTMGMVNAATENMGKGALAAMNKTLSGLGAAISNNVELNPTITPVLDLTQAKAGFDQLSALSKQQIIAATTSSSTASSISAQNAAAAAAAGVPVGGNTLNYTQNNYSPTALDATTIYRQTKNQLSVTKGALASANSG